MFPVFLLPLALVALGLLLIFLSQREPEVPDLVYTCLPPYSIPDLLLVSGVLVENRGGATAPNVKISITYDQDRTSAIRHLQVESEEPYVLRGGGEPHHFATLSLRELGPGKKLFIYWATDENHPPQVTVTSFRRSDKSRRTLGSYLRLFNRKRG